MTPTISEKAFEDAIECALLAGGEDECAGWPKAVREHPLAYGEGAPGGYHRRPPEAYDRKLCLLPKDLLDFILATQPRTWTKYTEHHGAASKEQLALRVAKEIEKRGALDVLRKGVKDHGCKFDLAYFRPSSGLNQELQTLYRGNLFSVVRQLRYSEKNETSLDLALFLNGIPLFTAELKTQFTGQSVEDAIKQYRYDRDPKEPLFAFGRCLAHFAVDPDLVFVTTQLAGAKTRFLPFNQGKFGGAGNPPVPPTQNAYATSYLWERVWAPDSVLNLIQHFIHAFDETDEDGKKTGKRLLIFPRYHQLDAVRRLADHARAHGPGQRYLVQHSAGSGKSNSIAWLAHQLSVLHDDHDQRVFDSIIVITDRRVLDRQLQTTVLQFQQTAGVVENIDQTSRQLKAALEGGKTIIVTTLQKFPVIADQVDSLPGSRFAVIVDEAHSSQSGEGKKHLNTALSAGSLEEAEEADATEPDDMEDRILQEMAKRGPLPNVSTFAFTATPKPKTLELFGVPQKDGSFTAFSLYSMRQAIEEGFILDVLAHYTTYHTYWSLHKTIEDDPRYEKGKASYLLKAFVDLHEHAIAQKLEIMVEHFHDQVAHRIGGKAKAMIVTRSRLHAVRYKLALDAYIHEKGYPYKALVAFSGTVRDEGKEYTEQGMNGVSEKQTARTFGTSAYRFLVVANKFQTGFDQALLHTMYVDKKLGGVSAVQTLSRLNRVHADKTDTMVLDFANEADGIKESFDPYYETTILSEGTDPHLLYDGERRLLDFGIFDESDLIAFAKLYFDPGATQAQLYAILKPIVDRAVVRAEDERQDFRKSIGDYVRLYGFLSQILTFQDADLERMYVFCRLLRRYLPVDQEDLPKEVQQNIDMESYRIQETYKGEIRLDRGAGTIPPRGEKGRTDPLLPEPVEPLSEIIRDLNERFGTNFTDKDKVSIKGLEERLAGNDALSASLKANTKENARLTFDHVVKDQLQEMVDTNFELYKRVTDDGQFAKFLLDWLFERMLKGVE
ncbi:MAG TPA: type I restriction endonuclease [Longimicrobiales bacterium]|nr:type I restriction endonuclease [Longimicrobiales bacterium]